MTFGSYLAIQNIMTHPQRFELKVSARTYSLSYIVESVTGKNVVITGASTGIGEQLAYQYARLGANVVITARREQRLKEVWCERNKHFLHDIIFHK